MPARAGASCRERLIRLKPGRLIRVVRTKNGTVISQGSAPAILGLKIKVYEPQAHSGATCGQQARAWDRQ